MNVNVNVGEPCVCVTVSARVSVSVNVCRGSFRRACFRADSHRSLEVDVALAERIGVLAPGGSYVVWDLSPCVRFLVCWPIEKTIPTGGWDKQRIRNCNGHIEPTHQLKMKSCIAISATHS